MLETLAVAATALLPIVARGAILRRPRIVRMAERADADLRLVRLLQRLRDKHGNGPLRLRVPGRSVHVVLSRADVRRVLDGSPEPFSPANVEKRHALGHFQPDGLLISDPEERQDRRRFTEAVLDTHSSVHELGPVFAAKISTEIEALLRLTGEQLDWDTFSRTWWRIVRRIVLGDAAADDERLIERLKSLRAKGNWAYLTPSDKHHREIFLSDLREHLARGGGGSLAERIAAQPDSAHVAPESQVAHWLFAFDAAGMATFQALALLASHPDKPRDHEHLRASVLEALRLWPTTPLLLRDGEGGTVLILAPFFHRDDTVLPYANDFEPEIWLGGRADPALVPFSGGPAVCPGRNLVLHVTAKVLASLFATHDFMLDSRELVKPLPGTLDPFGLRFAMSSREVVSSGT
ncbi:cytochrome P450 [Allokutzneria multivorans]|uniref:Cytochrome P450 n=1 Tax=Allokutzneria multivorans TaxID=1142134 RepID=A0ABP7SFK8_9PSEU